MRHCTEVRFASFLSGGFTTMAVINQPERKLAKRTSVHPMVGFPPLLTSSIFDLYKLETPQIKSQTMRHTLMNLV